MPGAGCGIGCPTNFGGSNDGNGISCVGTDGNSTPAASATPASTRNEAARIGTKRRTAHRECLNLRASETGQVRAIRPEIVPELATVFEVEPAELLRTARTKGEPSR